MDESTFERYDDEFTSLIQQIEESLAKEPPSPYTQGLLQQCDDLLQQMTIEARSSSSSVKRSLLDKVKSYKARYQSLVQQSERDGLLRSSSNNNAGHSERQRLQDNEDTLMNQNDTLERARRTMQETESVALEITDELASNREKLMSAHGRVREVGGLTGRASTILRNMSRRATQQKMIMYGVAVGLALAFIIILYTMWR